MNRSPLTLEEIIHQQYESLNSTEQRIADHLLMHHKELTFASATQVARDLNVSPSTIVRFAQRLGFEGYTELQQHLHQAFLSQHTLTNLTLASDGLLERSLAQDQENLALIKQHQAALSRAALLIARARRIWITGGRSSAYIAGLLRQLLRLVRPDVNLLGAMPGDLPDQLLDVRGEDVLVVIAMSRYNKETVDLVREIHTQLPIVLLVDEHPCPMAAFAQEVIRYSTKSPFALPSFTAAVATMHALFVETIVHFQDIETRLVQAEALWDTFGTFRYQEH